MRGFWGRVESSTDVGECKSGVLPMHKVALHIQHCFVATEVEKANALICCWRLQSKHSKRQWWRGVEYTGNTEFVLSG